MMSPVVSISFIGVLPEESSQSLAFSLGEAFAEDVIFACICDVLRASSCICDGDDFLYLALVQMLSQNVGSDAETHECREHRVDCVEVAVFYVAEVIKIIYFIFI